MVEKSSEDKKLKSESNTGSSAYQIERFTNKIKLLTEHLKINKKDHNTRRGLMKLVGKRKKLLIYVKTHFISLILQK